jgi:hypothetical protein
MSRGESEGARLLESVRVYEREREREGGRERVREIPCVFVHVRACVGAFCIDAVDMSEQRYSDDTVVLATNILTITRTAFFSPCQVDAVSRPSCVQCF